uniref:NKAP domain-containing 1 n=2 Tax=Xenopus tropicalis TaxID=8364 RepID=A0A803JW72_XENTR
MSRVPLGKVLLRNVIRHTDAHNKIQEETEMWKIRELEKQTEETYGAKRKRTSPDITKWDHSGFKELYPEEFDNNRGQMRSDSFDAEVSRDQVKSGADPAVTLRQDALSIRAWNKKYSECEASIPDRWGHSGYKELYPEEFDTDSGEEKNPKKKTNGQEKTRRKEQREQESHKRKRSKKTHKKKQKKRSHKKLKKRKKERDKSTETSSDSESSDDSSEKQKKSKCKKKTRKKAQRKKHCSSGQDSDSSSDEMSSTEDAESEEHKSRQTKRHRRKDRHRSKPKDADKGERRQELVLNQEVLLAHKGNGGHSILMVLYI